MARKIRQSFISNIEQALVRMASIEIPDTNHRVPNHTRRVWDSAIGKIVLELEQNGELEGVVREMVEEHPTCLPYSPQRVARMVWSQLIEDECSAVIDHITHETDGNGEQHYLELPDGSFKLNPAFDEKSFEAKEHETS